MFAVPIQMMGPRTRLFCIVLCLNELQKVDVRGPQSVSVHRTALLLPAYRALPDETLSV